MWFAPVELLPRAHPIIASAAGQRRFAARRLLHRETLTLHVLVGTTARIDEQLRPFSARCHNFRRGAARFAHARQDVDSLWFTGDAAAVSRVLD